MTDHTASRGSAPDRHERHLPRVVVVSTGGTIAMRRDPQTGGVVPAVTGDELVASVPAAAGLARLEVHALCNVPSSWMDGARCDALRRVLDAELARDDTAGAIVTHGTDTLEETAWWLDLQLSSAKPAVLTGAQRNASEADSDGPRNLLAAIRVVVDAQARGRGPMVLMNDRLHLPRFVTKMHTMNVESFDSGQAGLAGEMRGEASRARPIFFRPVEDLPRPLLAVGNRELPCVQIVAAHAGADGQVLRLLLREGVDGVVISALGMGNVSEGMQQAIHEAIDAGVVVMVSTRVARGPVVPAYGYVGGGRSLAALGAILAGDLSPQKARILLQLALRAGLRSRTQILACLHRAGIDIPDV